MKNNKFICILFVCAMFSIPSCTNQENGNATKESTQVIKPQLPQKTEGISDKEIEILSKIKADFESIMNSDNNANTSLGDLYRLHLAGLGDSFLQKNPISLNLPYNNKLRLAKYDDLLLNSNLWSFKCGYAGEDGNTILNYYCLDTAGSLFNYLKNSSPDNELIQNFVTTYTQAGDFTPNMQQSIILEAKRGLDFNNPDHQMFWVIYHLSLNEVMVANKAIQAYKSKIAKTKK